jgi:hypothetical protein
MKLKKPPILCLILFLINISFFSGCLEQSGQTHVKLVDYKVETKPDPWGGEYKKITGRVKNIAGNMIDKITIKIKFYDKKNELLETKTTYLYSISDGYIEDFSVNYYLHDSYYQNIDWNNIKFEFLIS